MKKVMFGILIAACLSAVAVVKQPDGSVILTQDEAIAVVVEMESMVTTGRQQQALIRELRGKLAALEKRECI